MVYQRHGDCIVESEPTCREPAMPSVKQLTDDIRQEFAARIARKTGWGSHQATLVLEEAMCAALAHNLAELVSEDKADYKRGKKENQKKKEDN